jgi:hypothetical protein
MRWNVALLMFAAVGIESASAATVTPIPIKGDALSFLHQVIGVHTAKSSMDEVRLYELCAASCREPTLVLRVVADNRPPAGKAAWVNLWKLPYTLRKIDSISLEHTTVRIEGWSYGRGTLSCTATFGISDNGLLSDKLEDGGCVKR